jgi:hypothetical protein
MAALTLHQPTKSATTQPQVEACARCGGASGLTSSCHYKANICADCREINRLEAAYEQDLERRSGCFNW